MMGRDVFPRADDVAVIQAFLLGETHAPSETLFVDEGRIGVHGIVVGWYDSAGALVMAANGPYAHTIARLMNQTADMLGLTDFDMKYERDDQGVLHWFAGGQLADPGIPVVLIGSLGLEAYRASVKRGVTRST